MEIVAHALWATAAVKAAHRKAATVGAVWLVIWTMFPDLLAFSPEVVVGLWYRLTGSAANHDFHHGAGAGWWNVDLYALGHSLVVFLAVFLVIWVIRRRPLWEMLGWALHILLDIPSHSAHFPTPFLWPLSSYFLVGVSWQQWWFMALNYATLAATFYYLRVNRKTALGPDVNRPRRGCGLDTSAGRH